MKKVFVTQFLTLLTAGTQSEATSGATTTSATFEDGFARAQEVIDTLNELGFAASALDPERAQAAFAQGLSYSVQHSMNGSIVLVIFSEVHVAN
jgi:hypothetical protein